MTIDSYFFTCQTTTNPRHSACGVVSTTTPPRLDGFFAEIRDLIAKDIKKPAQQIFVTSLTPLAHSHGDE